MRPGATVVEAKGSHAIYCVAAETRCRSYRKATKGVVEGESGKSMGVGLELVLFLVRVRGGGDRRKVESR